jgi:hypothetical protein
MLEYLHSQDSLTITFHHFHRAWLGPLSSADIQGLSMDVDSLMDSPPYLIHGIMPKEAMWNQIWANYIPLDQPSHMACVIPQGNALAPAVKVAMAKKSHRLTSLICQLCTGHCFDANYSNTFRTGTNDNTTCPCSHTPRCPNHLPHCCICQHTKEHVIFHCLKTTPLHDYYLYRIGSLRTIF